MLAVTKSIKEEHDSTDSLGAESVLCDGSPEQIGWLHDLSQTGITEKYLSKHREIEAAYHSYEAYEDNKQWERMDTKQRAQGIWEKKQKMQENFIYFLLEIFKEKVKRFGTEEEARLVPHEFDTLIEQAKNDSEFLWYKIPHPIIALSDVERIRPRLESLPVDDTTIFKLVEILIPDTSMDVLAQTKHKNIQDPISDPEFYQHIKRSAKQLSSIIGQLKKIQEKTMPGFFAPFPIKELEYNRQMCLDMIELFDTDRKKQLRYLHWDDNFSNKPLQKQSEWNHRVKRTVDILNKYYCTESCERPCKKIHSAAITKTAELLKTLYPEIWVEDTETVANRIKQKYYRASFPA